ncbi:MAG: hypothetical protein N2C12_05105, partial [Planctomycetales bacterium]
MTDGTDGTGPCHDLSGLAITADIAVDTFSQAEGFTITLSESISTGNVTVHYATLDLSTTTRDDYTAEDNTVTIVAGNTSAAVTVGTIDDGVDEGGPEYFNVDIGVLPSYTNIDQTNFTPADHVEDTKNFKFLGNVTNTGDTLEIRCPAPTGGDT